MLDLFQHLNEVETLKSIDPEINLDLFQGNSERK